MSIGVVWEQIRTGNYLPALTRTVYLPRNCNVVAASPFLMQRLDVICLSCCQRNRTGLLPGIFAPLARVRMADYLGNPILI
ncbi:MAG: hypothetical protein ACYSYL_21685 [Planctomycetota bacterium]